ncbi:hypothetical protein CC2G_007149 [Coprinopsis cinerea AmutBmut pab1-1]|nr:hypothetical protein CC2G_007149 [Coprinopsis cinerea AmutBmut pab1-1]
MCCMSRTRGKLNSPEAPVLPPSSLNPLILIWDVPISAQSCHPISELFKDDWLQLQNLGLQPLPSLSIMASAPAMPFANSPDVPPRTYPQPHPQQALVPPPSRAVSSVNWRILRDIVTNQQVEVKLRGGGWVIGIALTCVKFFEIVSFAVLQDSE